MGVILTADAISQAFAPVVVGRLFDLQRNYDWGFALLTVAALAAAVAATQIRTREIRSEHTTD
jgi:cyanate permease